MLQWEYTTLTDDATTCTQPEHAPVQVPAAVVDHGRQGWEMVGVTPLNPGIGTCWLLYTFKRPLA